MTAPVILSILDHFRMRKGMPIVQFLTWYLLLVEQWNFDDVVEFEIERKTEQAFHETVTVYRCRFTFKDGHISTLKVVEYPNGKMFADHMTSYYPSDTEEPPTNTPPLQG